ncbi:hypothetical protein HDV05_000413 [Chytridiales sp. JEL 0842]|nr:hypothetical protein HDV05_000413 [Chytridiales sp. JEL 0842]
MTANTTTLALVPAIVTTTPSIDLKQQQQQSPTSTLRSQKRKRVPVTDKQSFQYIARSLLAGGIAGCAAKTAVAPLDRVKILFQVNNPHFEKYSGSFFGVFRAAQAIKSQFGVYGLFQGHSATLLRIFPYAAIKFMAYEQFKDYIMPRKADETPFRRTLAGSLAGVTSIFFSYPLDLLRVRLSYEVKSAKDARTLFQTAKNIYTEPNPISPYFGFLNFYRGFMPTFYGMIPYAGVSFLTYETMKAWCIESPLFSEDIQVDGGKPSRKIRWWAQLVVGGLSGAVAQTSSYPMEVIRRHMQIGGKSWATQSAVVKKEVAGVAGTQTMVRFISTWETARNIWKQRGLKGFFVGLSIGYVKIVPMSAECVLYIIKSEDLIRV